MFKQVLQVRFGLDGGGLAVGMTKLAKLDPPLAFQAGDRRQTESLAAKALSGTLQDSIPPQTEACLVSGSVTVSGQISNPLTLSASDTFTMEFSACDDGAGAVSGTYSMRVTSFSGDLLSGSFALDVTVTLTGFAVTDAGETMTANGSLSMSLDYTAAPTLSISMTATSLTVSDGSSSQTLTSFSMTQTVDALTSGYSITVSGSLTSSAFDGEVDFSTTATLVSDGAGYAYTGQISITGAANATIDIIVLDGTLIRLAIDLDGDGTPDEFVDTTWDELLAQI